MSEENDPKIIVDDDWKQQVQREKEQIEKGADQTQAEDYSQIPEASFPLLVTTFTTQALSALGFVPNPATGKSEVNLELAKHFIDSLSVLEEKTQGNLTAEETSILNESLHQLRMAYVSVSQQGATKPADSNAPQSSIELP
ncbi:MAG: DUF1844 domain-containing protein [Planctomycetota bacterium]